VTTKKRIIIQKEEFLIAHKVEDKDVIQFSEAEGL